jgi:uncharacterized protein (DUF4415 family)
MKKENDFSKAQRGAVLSSTGKTRITLYLDDLVLSRLRAEAERSGKGYQTLINETLSRVLLAPPPSGRLAEECAKLGLEKEPAEEEIW